MESSQSQLKRHPPLRPSLFQTERLFRYPHPLHLLRHPAIVEKSEAVDYETEGCLSFPEMNGEVMRHKWIKVNQMAQNS